MKPVYNVTLCDPTYLQYSDEVLFNMAGDFLRVFRLANYRADRSSNGNTSRLFDSGSLEGRTIVKASPEGVTVDFSWASTHGWVHSQINDAETLIAEVLYRMQKKGIKFNADIDRIQVLEAEIADYIDKFCAPPALSADDLMYNAQQTCNDLQL